MSVPSIKCMSCTNDARYINSLGEWLCSLCDMNKNWRSVRISDIPELLMRLDTFMRGSRADSLSAIKELLWKK